MRLRPIFAVFAAALAWTGAALAGDDFHAKAPETGEPAFLLLAWDDPLAPIPPPPPPPDSGVLEETPEADPLAPASDGVVHYLHPAHESSDSTCCSGGDCCNDYGGQSGCSQGSCCNNGWVSSCCNCGSGWLDNTVGWVGWDAYKGVGDSTLPPGGGAGSANNSGLVSGCNTGVGFGDSAIRGQVGASYGLYDWLGRDTNPNPSAAEHQVFITAGVFKRSNVCCGDRIAWGMVYDQFFARNYGLFADEIALSQIRGLAGYALDDCNEIGVWGALQLLTDRIQPAGRNIHTANQFNAYWRHNWCFGGETMAYTGWFDAAGTNTFSFGMLGLAPLNDCVSVYGNFAYVVPVRGAGFVGSNDLIWNVSVGLQISFGGKARACNISGQQGLPLLPVANNGTFLITR